jgi:hypothetical protein
MLARLSHVFDSYIREYVVKALVLPVINLYDFIYAAASSSCLRRLDVAYNDLMRVILGVKRSSHIRIADLHRLTKLDKLSDRRQHSLHKFMLDIVEERMYSRLRLRCISRNRSYTMRTQGYVIPRFNTEIGRQRVVVRGLKLLNQEGHASS